MYKLLAYATAALGLAVPASASGVDLGGTFGSLGLGPQIDWRSEHFGLRGDGTFMTLKGHINSNGTRYRGKANLRSAGAWFDIFPFGGRFFLSGGARYNGNKGTISATPLSNTNIGGFVFTPQQIGKIDGRVSVKKFAPAAEMGIGSLPHKGFQWRIVGGALFQGKATLSPLTSSTGMIPQSRLDSERADLQHDLSKYRVYPIVQLELGFRF